MTIFSATWVGGRFSSPFLRCDFLNHLQKIATQNTNFAKFASCNIPVASARPEKCVFCTFHKKRTVFQIWGRFKASRTILRSGALESAIWPKSAPHGLKSALRIAVTNPPVQRHFYAKKTFYFDRPAIRYCP